MRMPQQHNRLLVIVLVVKSYCASTAKSFDVPLNLIQGESRETDVFRKQLALPEQVVRE